MIPKANQIYQHFKGNLYKVITLAKHSETGEDMVVYQALYGEYLVYTRPLMSFVEVLDSEKYPGAKQKYRFEPASFLVDFPEETGKYREEEAECKKTPTSIHQSAGMEEEKKTAEEVEQKENKKELTEEENLLLDPMLEAYLDANSYRERLNILHGIQHRITEHMLLTMSVVIDFELPEGSIQEKYDALHDCLLTRERYECNRMC